MPYYIIYVNIHLDKNAQNIYKILHKPIRISDRQNIKIYLNFSALFMKTVPAKIRINTKNARREVLPCAEIFIYTDML